MAKSLHRLVEPVRRQDKKKRKKKKEDARALGIYWYGS